MKKEITGAMVGSSLYLTPEVFEGRIYNSKADMYSLGFVLWEIWYVSKPFKRRWQPADCISSKRWDRVVNLLTSKGPIIHGKYGNMSWLIPGMKIHVPGWQQKKKHWNGLRSYRRLRINPNWNQYRYRGHVRGHFHKAKRLLQQNLSHLED